MNSSQQYFLQRKIFKKLNIKSSQLKHQLYNKSYLNFLKKIHQFEELCEGLSEPEIETVNLSDFKSFFNQLLIEKDKTVSELNHQNIINQELSEEDLVAKTIEELQEINNFLKTDFLNFQNNVQRWILKLYDINSIEKIDKRNYYLKKSFNLEIENLRNLQLSLHSKIIKNFVENNFKILLKKIDFIYLTVTQLYNFGNKMSDKPENMILKEEFHPPGTTLQEQKNTIIEYLKNTENDLKIKLKSIHSLEDNINELEMNLSRLTDEREKAQSMLDNKKYEMEELMKKISELEKLTDEIDNKIKNSFTNFNTQIDELEKKKLEVLENPNLTEDEKEKLLKEMYEEMNDLKKSYGSELDMLTKERDDLSRQSKIFACDIDKSWCNFQENHLTAIDDLKKQKIGATSSEIDRINKEIEILDQKFIDESNLVERSKCRSDFLSDEFGRYFTDECGRKIYKRHSNASEYIRMEDGTFKKINEGVSIQLDEIGDYYIDEAGEKVYIRKYLEDENGRYFLEPNGRRVYKSDPEASEYEFVNGVMIKIKEGVYEKDEYGNRTRAEPESEKEPEEANEYIKWAVGRALVPGLAAVTVNQPLDPLTYLSNFLLQYRYNEIQNYEKEKEIKEFLEERERVLNGKTDCNEE